MVLICKPNNFRDKPPSMLKIIEEKKRTYQIFIMPLKGIQEEPQIKKEYTNINLQSELTDAELKIIFGSR